MNRFNLISQSWRWFAFGAVLLLTAHPCSAQTSPLLPQDSVRVALLKTDRVMIGRIKEEKDFYQIQLDTDSKVSIPRPQVLFVGNSVEEVYEFKKSLVKNWRTGDHFQLTRWCIANDLAEQAIEHFEATTKLANGHPKVHQLGLELQKKLLSDPAFREHLGLLPMEATNKSTNSPEPTSVVTAAMEATRSLSPIATNVFHARIQPILVNRCGQAACHGVQSQNSLRLIEPFGKSAVRTSSENLQAVLANLDRHAPSDLPRLVQLATTAHGLQKQPGISIADGQLLAELTNWVQMIEHPVVTAEGQNGVSNTTQEGAFVVPAVASSNEPQSNSLSPVPLGSAPVLRTVPDSMSTSYQGGILIQPQFIDLRHGSDPFPGATPSSADLEALNRELDRILSLEQGRIPTTPLADPFDPEAFNSRNQQQN